MGKEVLIFMHMNDATPGYIGDFFRMNKIPFRIIRSYNNESIPALDDSMAGLVFMGGVMSANDEISWIKDEIQLIQQALEIRLPLLGHCLGGQLISKALGQTISENTVPEVGWHSCESVQNESADEWLGIMDEPFTMFHWHYETFSVPVDAQHLFSSAHCENQAYSYRDNVLAMQCHVEMTEELLTDWITKWKSSLKTESASEQSYAQIKNNLLEKIADLNQVAEKLYGRWAAALST